MGCYLRLKEMYDTLPPKEQQVAATVLETPEAAAAMSVEELAAACGTSTASVVRMCKKLGYAGYKEFSRMLSNDMAIGQHEGMRYADLQPGATIDAIIGSVIASSIQALENTRNLLEAEEVRRATDAISMARRVDFYGVGTSGTVALDAHNKFLRINKHCLSSADPHIQILSATSLEAGDVAVLISYTGETLDMIELLRQIRKTGATVITITRYGKNTLSTQSDIRLYTASAESMIRSGPMSSRISQLAVIDILYTAVCSQQYGDVKAYLDNTMRAARAKHRRGIGTEVQGI